METFHSMVYAIDEHQHSISYYKCGTYEYEYIFCFLYKFRLFFFFSIYFVDLI